MADKHSTRSVDHLRFLQLARKKTVAELACWFLEWKTCSCYDLIVLKSN